jgi:hypothetical protein
VKAAPFFLYAYIVRVLVCYRRLPSAVSICRKKIITPKLTFRGDYLYDKGENDELCNIGAVATDLIKYILARLTKKVKDTKKIFSKK